MRRCGRANYRISNEFIEEQTAAFTGQLNRDLQSLQIKFFEREERHAISAMKLYELTLYLPWDSQDELVQAKLKEFIDAKQSEVFTFLSGYLDPSLTKEELVACASLAEMFLGDADLELDELFGSRGLEDGVYEFADRFMLLLPSHEQHSRPLVLQVLDQLAMTINHLTASQLEPIITSKRIKKLLNNKLLIIAQTLSQELELYPVISEGQQPSASHTIVHLWAAARRLYEVFGLGAQLERDLSALWKRSKQLVKAKDLTKAVRGMANLRYGPTSTVASDFATALNEHAPFSPALLPAFRKLLRSVKDAEAAKERPSDGDFILHAIEHVCADFRSMNPGVFKTISNLFGRPSSSSYIFVSLMLNRDFWLHALGGRVDRRILIGHAFRLL